MSDYSKSKIYKIISNQTNDIYIGSTIKPRLCDRMGQHRYEYRKGHGCDSELLLQYDDAKIILLENYPCNSSDEKRAREQYWIDNTYNCINKKKLT